jgi:hypothetical protein
MTHATVTTRVRACVALLALLAAAVAAAATGVGVGVGEPQHPPSAAPALPPTPPQHPPSAAPALPPTPPQHPPSAAATLPPSSPPPPHGAPPPPPSPPSTTTTTPVVLAPALLTRGRLVVPAASRPPPPPFNVSLCGGLDLHTVSSRLPREACLVEVRAVCVGDFATAVDDATAAVGSLRHVPGPALAAGLFNWPHYGHALGNSLFGLWATLVEAGLAGGGEEEGGGGASAGRGRAGGAGRLPVPVYVRACGQGQDALDAATTADGDVNISACTPLAPAFHAVAGPTRGVQFRSWAAAADASSDATPLLFHHLVVGLSRSADQYNHTLDGRLLRSLAARVAEEVGVEEESGGGGEDGGAGLHHTASSRLAGLLTRHRVRARHTPPPSPPPPPPPTVLVIHRAGSRVIENEGALVAALERWARARGGGARAVSFERLTLADVVATVRRPAWVALVGVDGTGLLNAVWARPGCGVGVRLATWGASALLPNKGLNFDRVANATAGGSAVWECGERECARLEATAARMERVVGRVLEGDGSASSLTYAQKFLWVTRQGVAVDVGAVVGMVDAAWARAGKGVCGGGGGGGGV